MKNYWKLIFIILFSFCFSVNVNAEEVSDEYACNKNGESKFIITTPDPTVQETYDDFYKSSGWNAENYVCESKEIGNGYSNCYADLGAAAGFCTGLRTYYRGKIGHMSEYVSCDPSTLNTIDCISCSVTCKKSEKTYIAYNIKESDCDYEVDGCSKHGGTTVDGEYIEEYRICDCYKLDTETDTVSKSFSPGQDGRLNASDNIDYYEGEIKKYCAEGYTPDESTAACNVSGVSVVYKKYQCIAKPKIIEGVREPQFEVNTLSGDKVAAYCLNPDYLYPGTHHYIFPENSSAFDEDGDINATNLWAAFVEADDFDPTTCLNTTSKYCGFANILIEGYYRAHYNKDTKTLNKNVVNDNYSYSVIGAALRLWGAHKGLGGYDKTGILDEDDSTIGNDSWLAFVHEPGTDTDPGSYVNVYKQTLKKLLESNIYYLTYKVNDEEQNESIHRVDTTAYNFNALNQFKKVTCEIIEDENIVKNGVLCGNDDGSNSNYLYALSLFANTFQDNKLMKKHLLEISYLVNDVNITNTPLVESTPVSGNVTINGDILEIKYEFEEDVDIKCNILDSLNVEQCKANQTVTIYVENVKGELIEKDFLIDNYDYCNKNYCHKKIVIGEAYAKCDVLKKITSTVTDWLQCQNKSIYKYISCLEDIYSETFQEMISFEPQKCSKPTTTIDLYYNCGNPSCIEGPSDHVPNCTTSGVDNSKGYVYREVSDPSLSCILNKDINGSETDPFAGKGFYDYSSLFGVNEEVCKVYCSDKVEYYMASKEKVSTSLQLKYNIESRVLSAAGVTIKDNEGNELKPSYPNKNSDKLITDTIVVKRTCVSEIFYDNNEFTDLKKYINMYGEELFVDSEGNLKTSSNWSELYHKLYAIELEEVGELSSAYATLDKYIYDLYNCNFFNGSDIKDITGIDKPEGVNNSYQIANNLLQDAKKYCNNNECVSAQIAYQGGTKHTFDSSYAGNNGIIDEKVDPDKKVDPYLKQDIHVSNLENLEVKYCDVGECFDNSSDFEDNLENAHGSHSAKVPYGTTQKDIPSNDYAIFSYSIEVDLYNATNYLTEPHTGNVIDSLVVSDDESKNYLKLDSYVYPIASSLNNRCEEENGVYTCNVEHNINIPLVTNDETLKIFDRKNNNDKFINLVQTASSYSCEYDADRFVIGADKVAYRNIDINNPIPHIRKSNWSSDAPSQDGTVSNIISRIKNSGDNNLYANDDYLEYSFVLDSKAIESIRTYNDSIESVLLNSETSSEFYRTSCIDLDVNGKKLKLKCKSEFINKLNEPNSILDVNVIKGDGISEYTENKCKVNPDSFECK